jgi:hypothetical protein
MLKGGVIQKLLEEKWKTFGHVGNCRSFIRNIFTNDCVHLFSKRLFLRRIFRTLFHLLILSIAIYLRPSKNELLICESEAKKVVSFSICMNGLRT